MVFKGMDREFLILLIFFNYLFYPKSPVSLFKLDKNNSFGYDIYILTNFQCFHTQGRNQNKCVFFFFTKICTIIILLPLV